MIATNAKAKLEHGLQLCACFELLAVLVVNWLLVLGRFTPTEEIHELKIWFCY